MGSDNGATDRQTHAHAGLLGNEKGLKELRFCRLADTSSTIGAGQLQKALVMAFGTDCQAPILDRHLRHGVSSIAEKIQHHLLDLHRVAYDRRQVCA